MVTTTENPDPLHSLLEHLVDEPGPDPALCYYCSMAPSLLCEFCYPLRVPKSRRQQKACRASISRTINAVRSLLASWSSIFSKVTLGQKRPLFNPPPDVSCSELANFTKKFLANCPSNNIRAVMAFQSIKKALPDSCACMSGSLLDDLAESLKTPPPPLPRHYLRFVEKQTLALFKKGWDSRYEGYCRRTSPPIKSCQESKRHMGGTLSALQSNENFQLGQADYLEVVLHGRAEFVSMDSLGADAILVQSAGKPRPLTKFSAAGLFLRPLHKTIYDHLSKKKWLLRGDLSDSKLTDFDDPSLPLISGDYKSATDNLPIEVMETALRAMMKNAMSVPPCIAAFALVACRPLISFLEDDASPLCQRIVKEVVQPLKGQMMGSFLSFPFLCLQNYLAFRWAFREKKWFELPPVRINGDDILFQSTEAEARNWMSVVKGLGLEVERSKTSISLEYGTLNSTLVEWADSSDRYSVLLVVPTLRFGMLRRAEFPHSLGRQFSQFVAGHPCQYSAGMVFFQHHLQEMKNTSYSLPSLGFRGRLAFRLAEKFGLDSLRRISATPPSPPHPHNVTVPSDLVVEVPEEYATEEVQEASACEIAAWKWQHPFSAEERVREAVRYCINSTNWTDDSETVGLLVHAFSLSDDALRWRFSPFPLKEDAVADVRRRGGGCLSPDVGPNRRMRRKPYLDSLDRRSTIRVHYAVFREMIQRAGWFSGGLPTYEEALQDGAVQRCEGSGAPD